MSKRFGRNQKRAMREALESTTFSLEDMRKQRDNIITNQQPLVEALRRVARVLGPCFYGLPVTERVVARINDTYRMARPIDVVDVAYAADLHQIVSGATMELDTIRARELRESLSRQVHVRLTTGRGEVAYGISATALHTARPDDLARELTPIIAYELAEYITGNKQ